MPLFFRYYIHISERFIPLLIVKACTLYWKKNDKGSENRVSIVLWQWIMIRITFRQMRSLNDEIWYKYIMILFNVVSGHYFYIQFVFIFLSYSIELFNFAVFSILKRIYKFVGGKGGIDGLSECFLFCLCI